MTVTDHDNPVETVSSLTIGAIAPLLREMHLLSPPGAEEDGNVTSTELIKANTLQVSKWTAGLLGGVGVLTGVLGALGAWLGRLSSGERMMLFAAAALVLTGTALSISWLIVTDVRARVAVTVARLEGRVAVLHDCIPQPNRTPEDRTATRGTGPTGDLWGGVPAWPGRLLR